MNTIAYFTMAFICFFTIIVIFVHQVDSKSMSLTQKNSKSDHSISKRNAWWSKKSMDSYNRIIPEAEHSNAGNTCKDLKLSFACYTEDCVSEFVWCMQESSSQTGSLRCQIQHKLCISKCLDHLEQASLDSLLQ